YLHYRHCRVDINSVLTFSRTTRSSHDNCRGSTVTAATPLIEARGLRVQFGKVTALDGLDLVARPGQVLAILGPNGAGKTTFVRTGATLVPPSGGELRVRGIDVTRHPAAVRREIGLAGQLAAVEPAMTGRENLQMIARLFGHRRRAAGAAAPRWEGVGRPGGGRPPPCRNLLRRPAPPPRPGRQPGRGAAAAAPGRADHRPGPRRARRSLGRGAQPRRRRH